MDDVLGVRPLVYGEDFFLGADDPNPTGVGGSTRLMGVPLELTRPGAPPPDLIDEVLRTELPPRGDDSSEFRDMLEPNLRKTFLFWPSAFFLLVKICSQNAKNCHKSDPCVLYSNVRKSGFRLPFEI